jgi:hypothetical protein
MTAKRNVLRGAELPQWAGNYRRIPQTWHCIPISSRLNRIFRDANGGQPIVGEFVGIMAFPESRLPLIVIPQVNLRTIKDRAVYSIEQT